MKQHKQKVGSAGEHIPPDHAHEVAKRLRPTAGKKLDLPAGLKTSLEAKTGYSMKNVNLRESDQPSQMGATAYARGNTIDFAKGAYNPHSAEGRSVIGHEVSHVIQQARGQVKADSSNSPINSSPSLEQAADVGVSASGGGSLAAVPSMSFSSAPVQGLFDGLKKKFRAAKAEYNFGKTRKKLDSFQGRELAAARGEAAQVGKNTAGMSAMQQRRAQLTALDGQTYRRSDEWGELEADSRDAVTGDVDPSQMNSFWSRLGRGTLFGRKNKEAQRSQQAEDFRNEALLDRDGTAELNTINSRFSRSATERGASTARAQARPQDAAKSLGMSGEDLMSAAGGRQYIGLFQNPDEKEGYGAQGMAKMNNMYLKRVAMDGNASMQEVVRVLEGPINEVLSFDLNSIDTNDFDSCADNYATLTELSKKSMSTSDLLKKYGKEKVWASLGSVAGSPEDYSRQMAAIGLKYRDAKRKLEEYQD